MVGARRPWPDVGNGLPRMHADTGGGTRIDPG